MKFYVEEAISGQEFSLSCLVAKQQIIASYIDREILNIDINSIDQSYWLNKIPNWSCMIRKEISSLIKKKHLSDGVFHCQFIVDQMNKNVFLIDFTRRMSGDYYSREVYNVTGFNWMAVYLKLLMGEEVSLSKYNDTFLPGRLF